LEGRAGNGTPGQSVRRVLAQGEGWSLSDVACTYGPRDRPFEERHSGFCIALVLAGSFQYRSAHSRETMTPGSLRLGRPGQFFECSHEHAAGDRCLSYCYTPEYFEEIVRDPGAPRRKPDFRLLRLPPLRPLSRLAARISAAAEGAAEEQWEELGVQLAVQTMNLAGPGLSPLPSVTASAEARVTRAARQIERHPEGQLRLSDLAREAGLSRYHFLRVFELVTGVSPHQYVLRARLRLAAVRLAVEPSRVLDIALDCGFGDVSNFNRAFHAEFGVAPRTYRRERTRHLAEE